MKGIVGNHWSTWLSDCAANAETLLLLQLHARCALEKSVYLCGRPRALREPAQNTRIKRARRAPSSFRRDIFPTRGKQRDDSPLMTTMSNWLGTKEKAGPAHPRTLRDKNKHFRGTFSDFWREDLYLASGRRCGVPIRFSWMIPCSRNRAVRSFSSRRYLTEGR